MATINGDDRANSLAGTAKSDVINGLGGDDELFGNAGNDTLNGGDGGDILVGGAGNDTLNGGGGNGVDTADYWGVKAGVTVNLVTGKANDGEGGTDTLNGIENVRGTDFRDEIIGDQASNFLNGNAGADHLSGNGGNDILSGGDGSDTILGGSGEDKITGGKGADIMTGGSDADLFQFFLTSEVGVGASFRDVIRDFQAGLDKIAVSAIDADTSVSGNQAFTFVGGSAFNDEGQIRAVAHGGGTLLQFNTTGTSGAEFEIFLETPVQVSAGDFFL